MTAIHKRTVSSGPGDACGLPLYTVAFRTQWRFALTIMVLVMSGSYMVYSYSEEMFTTCKQNPYVRHDNPDKHGTAFISRHVREFLFFPSVYLVQLICFLVMLFTFRKQKSAIVMTFAMCVLLYVPGWFLVEGLKDLSDDKECRPLGETTGKTNGWSGHWYYIMYQFLTVHYSALLLMGPVGSYSTTAGKSNASQTRSVYLLLPFYTAVALLINGMATWVYGYHSLQQCFLGSVSGIIYSTIVLKAVQFWVPLVHQQKTVKQLQ